MILVFKYPKKYYFIAISRRLNFCLRTLGGVELGNILYDILGKVISRWCVGF